MSNSCYPLCSVSGSMSEAMELKRFDDFIAVILTVVLPSVAPGDGETNMTESDSADDLVSIFTIAFLLMLTSPTKMIIVIYSLLVGVIEFGHPIFPPPHFLCTYVVVILPLVAFEMRHTIHTHTIAVT